MIRVDENYKLVQDLLSKNNGAYISPEEYTRYARMVNSSLADALRGADTNKKSAYGINRTLDARLRVLRKEESIPLSNGVGNYPTDWLQTLSVYDPKTNKPIRPLDEDRAKVAFQDPYRNPYGDFDNDIYEDTSTGIKVHSKESLNEVRIIYLRKPKEPKYVVKIVNERPVFDSTNSVNFDWDEGQNQDIAMRIIQLAGLSIGNGQVVQFAHAKQTEE